MRIVPLSNFQFKSHKTSYNFSQNQNNLQVQTQLTENKQKHRTKTVIKTALAILAPIVALLTISVLMSRNNFRSSNTRMGGISFGE